MKLSPFHLALISLVGLMSAVAPSHAQDSMPDEMVDPTMPASEPVEKPSTKPKTPTAKPDIKSVAPVDNYEEAAPLDDKPKEYSGATLRGLNKVTARIVTIDAPVNIVVPFGTLSITLKKCWKSAPEERPESAALMEIIDHKPGEPPRNVFSGWMFASSPAISALEHPVYDVTMLDCVEKK